MDYITIVLSSVAAVSTILSFTYWHSLTTLRKEVEVDENQRAQVEHSRYINKSIARVRERVQDLEKNMSMDIDRRIENIYRDQEDAEREYRAELANLEHRLYSLETKDSVKSNDFSSL